MITGDHYFIMKYIIKPLLVSITMVTEVHPLSYTLFIAYLPRPKSSRYIWCFFLSYSLYDNIRMNLYGVLRLTGINCFFFLLFSFFFFVPFWCIFVILANTENKKDNRPACMEVWYLNTVFYINEPGTRTLCYSLRHISRMTILFVLVLSMIFQVKKKNSILLTDCIDWR